MFVVSRCGAYANSACIETVEKYGEEYIKDKVGMVIGTQDPWAERGLIHHGAKHIITVEYMKIGAFCNFFFNIAALIDVI